MNDQKPTDEQLRELARRFFAEARERSAKEDAEIAGWKKQHRKRHSVEGGGWSDGFSSDGGSGCGDGGGGD